MIPDPTDSLPPGAYAVPVLRAAGDAAVLVEFGDRLDPAINNAALAYDSRLRDLALAGILETAPTIRSVLVRFDPLALPPARLREQLAELASERNWFAAPPPPGRSLWRIPACYGGGHGPDLDEVAKLMDCSTDEAVARHAATRQRVFMLGFAPGVAYLGLLPEAWALPRLREIRPEVAAGSVLVAVRQTVLFAAAMPTGWRTIARTPWRSFDADREPPVMLSPGDEVTFSPVSADEFARLARRVEDGIEIATREALP